MKVLQPPYVGAQDVFILGAGFSRAISESMPLMKELNHTVANRLGQDYRRLSASFDGDFELTMTFLAQAHPWLKESERLRNKALFLEASEAIGKDIEAAMNQACSHPCPEWLVRFAHYLHDHRCTVITLNYDTLLERAFQAIELGQQPKGQPLHFVDPRALFPIDFQAPGLGVPKLRTATVLKLHGSTNWFYSGRSQYFGEPLRYRHPTGWSPALMISEPELAGRFPLIVPPVADKLGYFQNEAVQYLWSYASAALKNCRTSHGRLFLVGYSLPATDLTMRFLLGSDTQGGELEMVPVNNVTDINSQINQLFPKRYQITCKYQGNKAVERMVDGLSSEYASLMASLEKNAGGPVEERIRATLVPGCPLSIPKRRGRFRIGEFYASGMTIITGAANVNTFISWDCLEALVPKLKQMNSPVRVFGNHDPDYHGIPRFVEDCLASWFTRSMGPWITGLLAAAGIVNLEETVYETVFTSELKRP